MKMQTITQIPGIRFETQPPPAADTLPRLDIAAFVGFASRGPLHIPVPVEDIARFRDIFGDDQPLAWNSSERRMEYSHLGPSVEAFFRNGGRQCWVVRVADESAQTNTFALPGLVGINEAHVKETVLARGRCPGSWSDDLRIGAVLQTTQLVLGKAEACIRKEGKLLNPCQCQVDLPGLHPDMRPGDLLRITFPEHEDILFLFIAKISRESGGIRITGTRGYWFCTGGEPVPAGIDPLFASSNGWRLYRLSDTEQLGREFVWPGESPETTTPRISMLRFEMQAWRNDVCEHSISNLAFSSHHPRFWRYLPDDAGLFRHAGPRPIVAPETNELLKEASEPRRFPIAGPEVPDVSTAEEVDEWCYLPINMPSLIDPELASGPEAGDHDNTPRLERDGLASFRSQIFFDAVLADMGIGSLLQEAERRYSLSASPIVPRGIHSLLPIEEVTLLAVPDAVHRQWSREAPPQEELLEAPFLQPVTREEASGKYRASWSKVAGATSYLLHYDTSPEFIAPTSLVIKGETIERVGQPLELLPEPDTSLLLDIPGDCPRNRYFRVRTERLGTVSAWSNTRTTILPFREFSICDEGRPDLLELMLEAEAIGPSSDMRFFWTLLVQIAESPNVGDEVFELFRAVDIEFQSAKQVYCGSSLSVTTAFPSDEVSYYRVRAWNGDTPGPWSNTIRIAPTTVSLDALQTVSAYDNTDLLHIHQALIRLCAARGDMMAVLSLPRHYRTTDSLEHVAALTAPGEERVPSYAALYHPWLAARGEAVPAGAPAGNQVMFSPPDGAIIGAIAKRTRESGAWIAPANDPLTGAVALDPDLSREEWGQLLSAGVNVLRRDPRGFLVLSAGTLSPNEDLRPINVRRLMILLRRLALREGTRYVFESNDEDFRSGVRRQFEQLLSGLYIRGAFAGKNAGEAYRVVADSSVNARESLDQGRFIVELRVAPSQPLQFLTIRLAQSGPADLRVREI